MSVIILYCDQKRIKLTGVQVGSRSPVRGTIVSICECELCHPEGGADGASPSSPLIVILEFLPPPCSFSSEP